jgi:hypothetical protein
MKIDSTEFGSITIDGTTYPHDVLIHLSGEVAKRKKKLHSIDAHRVSPQQGCEYSPAPTGSLRELAEVGANQVCSSGSCIARRPPVFWRIKRLPIKHMTGLKGNT